MAKQYTILIADDEKLIRDGMKLMLGFCPIHIEEIMEAENGQQAIDLLRIGSVDVVLMDISMPVLNGVTATKIIRSEFPDVKVIIISMHMDVSDIAELVAVKTHGYILKENFSNEIGEALTQVIADRVFYGERVRDLL